MFEAQLLIATGTDYDVYGPWMRRGGDNLRATIDVVAKDAASLSISLLTKNSEDTGDGTDADSTVTLSGSSLGRTPAEWRSSATKGPKELIRYRFRVSGAAGKWILFRMLPIVWWDSAGTT